MIAPLSAKQEREWAKHHAKEARETKKMENEESRKQELHEIKMQEAAVKAGQGVAHKEELHNLKVKELGGPLSGKRMNREKMGLPSNNPLAGAEVFHRGQHMLPKGTDTVPAMLTPGEAVIPKAAAQDPKNKPLIKQMVQQGRQAQYHAQGTTGIVQQQNLIPILPKVAPKRNPKGYAEGTESVPNLNNYYHTDSAASMEDGTTQVEPHYYTVGTTDVGQPPPVPLNELSAQPSFTGELPDNYTSFVMPTVSDGVNVAGPIGGDDFQRQLVEKRLQREAELKQNAINEQDARSAEYQEQLKNKPVAAPVPGYNRMGNVASVVPTDKYAPPATPVVPVKVEEPVKVEMPVAKTSTYKVMDANGKIVDMGDPVKNIINKSFQTEGGFVADDAGRGPTNHGINWEANQKELAQMGYSRDTMDKLTREDAAKLYETKYIRGPGFDKLYATNPALANAVIDASINMGQDTAKKLLEASGGDVIKFNELRKAQYDKIIANDPSKAKYKKAWYERTDKAASMNPAATVGEQRLTPLTYREQITKGNYVPEFADDQYNPDVKQVGEVVPRLDDSGNVVTNKPTVQPTPQVVAETLKTTNPQVDAAYNAAKGDDRTFLETFKDIFSYKGLKDALGLNNQDVARMGAMYLGSRARGYDGARSLSFAGRTTFENSLHRQDREEQFKNSMALQDRADARQANMLNEQHRRTIEAKLIEAGYPQEAIDKYFKTNDARQLGEPTRTTVRVGESRTMMSTDPALYNKPIVVHTVEEKTGKRKGDRYEVATIDGREVPLDALQKQGLSLTPWSESTHGVTGKTERQIKNTKFASEVADEILTAELGADNVKGKANPNRQGIPGPKQIADQAGSYFSNIGFNLEDGRQMQEARLLMGNATKDMLAAKNAGTKINSIEPYLARNVITQRMGIDPNALMLEKDKPMPAEKIVDLNNLARRFSAVSNDGKPNEAQATSEIQRLHQVWANPKSAKLREQFKGTSNETAFYQFATEALRKSLEK